MGTSLEPIVVELEVAAPVERVWRRWTDQGEVRLVRPRCQHHGRARASLSSTGSPTIQNATARSAVELRSGCPHERLAFEW